MVCAMEGLDAWKLDALLLLFVACVIEIGCNSMFKFAFSKKNGESDFFHDFQRFCIKKLFYNCYWPTISLLVRTESTKGH